MRKMMDITGSGEQSIAHTVNTSIVNHDEVEETAANRFVTETKSALGQKYKPESNPLLSILKPMSTATTFCLEHLPVPHFDGEENHDNSSQPNPTSAQPKNTRALRV
jgi:hypothetical protein